MICVLDACAMLAYLGSEKGGDQVSALLRDPEVTCLAQTINVIET